MGCLWIGFVLVTLGATPGLASQRFIRRAGDQSPSGQCTTFKWGGRTRLHWYVCCNNCADDDKSCDGKTYQSASTYSYCDTCGTDNKDGNGSFHRSYGCGGCDRQNIIRDGCSMNLFSIVNLKGYCWAFTKCFELYCKPSRKRSLENYRIPADRFNLQCDEGEDFKSNPTDCCGTVNPQCNFTAYKGTNDCPPACCGEPACCLPSTGSRQPRFGLYLVIVVILLAPLIVLQ